MIQRFINFHNFNTDLFRSGARLWGLVQAFEITAPSWITIDGYANIRHKGNPNVVVGLSSRVGYRFETDINNFNNTTTYPTGTQPGSWNTPGFTWIPGAKDGKNILSLSQHYETLLLNARIQLNSPGAYRIEPYCFEMSSLAPNQDGITCINTDTNQLITDTFGFMSIIVETI